MLHFGCSVFLSQVSCFLTLSCTEWTSDYISSLPPPADKLQSEIEQYMLEYDRKVEEVSSLLSIAVALDCRKYFFRSFVITCSFSWWWYACGV